LARIRGDVREEERLRRTVPVVRAASIESDDTLGPLLEHPPPELDDDSLTLLRHIFEAGSWVLLESALADLPSDLRWLYESGAVTIDQLASLHDAFGVTSVADFAAVVEQHAVRSVPGLDEQVELAVAHALGTIRRSTPRIPLGRAVGVAEPVLARLREIEGVQWATAAGSLRRGQDTVGDIELLAATAQPAIAVDATTKLPGIDRVLQTTPHRVCLLINRVQVGVRLYEPYLAGPALLYLTGSSAHFRALRRYASGRGLHLDARGLRHEDGVGVATATEADIYAALGLPFIPPEIREGDGEVPAAARGLLPRLIADGDIRGDLHVHSDWSDGSDTIEAMVQTARTLGYEYVAITDHSPHAGATRTLSLESISRQADEIEALRARFPDIAILHGCEVDILPGGRLDFPDEVLERLDIVLASLHDPAGQEADRLLKRYVDAMRHPLVTVITHPANRVVAHRPGYELDYDRLFDAALDTGTFLEIDGAPAHLDMDGALARRAAQAGVGLVVNSDGHRAVFLGWQMRLGITTARRGWVEARQVLNSRPLAEVVASVRRKRTVS
jgi:DNA polymerase (family 10)